MRARPSSPRSRFAGSLPALLSLALAAGAACSPDEVPLPGRGRAPIIDGTRDFGDPAVVTLTWGTRSTTCTGTLITSRIVLTAGHCVDGGVPDSVFFGRDTTAGGTVIPIVGGYPHPEYDSDDFRFADIGVVVLQRRADEVPLPYNTAPLDLAFVGRDIRIVGFGFQEIGQTGEIGEKMQKTVPITGVRDKEVTYGPAVCNGDSGGPGFVTFDDGVERVTGITSWGADESCASYGGSARVDIYASWLAGVIEAEDPISCERDARCADGCEAADPDCPCSPDDGFCSELCADTDTDPDCPAGCGGGGDCAEGCPLPDPDCGDPCQDEGHCVQTCATRDPDCGAPLAPGAACTEDFDCGDGARCLADPVSGAPVCTGLCAPGGDECGAGQECRTILPGTSVCREAEDANDGDGGCAVAGSGAGARADGRPSAAGAAWAGLLLGLAGLLGLARRRPVP